MVTMFKYGNRYSSRCVCDTLNVKEVEGMDKETLRLFKQLRGSGYCPHIAIRIVRLYEGKS